MNTKFAIGIDLGGTNIKSGIVTDEGKIIRTNIIKTYSERGPEKVIQQIEKGIKILLKNNRLKIDGAGIGAPGSVTQREGIVKNPPNLPGWGEVPLKKILEGKIKKQVYVENDANAAAIGELMFGAGKQINSFIMITLGTGVGGGIIIEKKLYRGTTGAAGEIGHVTIDYKGKHCKCGSYGCIETYIGNSYLVEDVKKKLKKHKESVIYELIKGDYKLLTPKIIGEAAKKDDEFAKDIIRDAGKKLGFALSSVVNLLDIETIIIGGGVAGLGSLLFESVKNGVKDRVLQPLKGKIIIKHAKLKNQAGVKGASALVFYNL